MIPDPETLRKLTEIHSEGFNLEAEEFHEAIGLSKDDLVFLANLVEKLEEDTQKLSDAFHNVLEISKYSTDEIVKAFLMFHLGVIIGKRFALKNIEDIDKEVFAKAYKQGFTDGFKSGFEKGLEMADFVKNPKEEKAEKE